MAIASQLEAEHASNLPQLFADRLFCVRTAHIELSWGCSLPVHCSATSTECPSAQFCHLAHQRPSLLIRGRHSKDSFKKMFGVYVPICVCICMQRHTCAEVCEGQRSAASATGNPGLVLTPTQQAPYCLSHLLHLFSSEKPLHSFIPKLPAPLCNEIMQRSPQKSVSLLSELEVISQLVYNEAFVRFLYYRQI